VPHERRFRFGVLAKQARPAAEFRDLARRAEDLGFATFFMPDHFVEHPLAPIPGIMAAAAATTTLRVGTLVLGNDYKHPVVLANEAATIDLLSDGRLELGVGAGWMTADYEQGGFDLDPAGVRIVRLDESLTVLKGLMADGPFTFHGEHYRIDGLDGEPKPVQRPHPPIVIGGNGPTRTLRTTARWAQQWNSISRDVPAWLGHRAVLHERCAEIGRDPAEITCSVNVRLAGRADVGAMAEQAAAYAEAGADLLVVNLAAPHDARVIEPVAEALAPLAA
jgi:probable F420-dependent oxidoreductase